MTIRKHIVWTQERVITSPYNNIEIPNCTLYDYVWQNLDKWPERTACVCAVTGRGYTYENAFKLSNTFASNLRTKFSVRDGDVIAVMLPNMPEFPLVALGILAAGGIITSYLSVCTAHEVERLLIMSAAKIIVTAPEIYPTVAEAISLTKQNIPVIIVKTNEESTPQGTTLLSELCEDVNVDKTCLKEVRRSADDICFLPYSSGTTGLPKGVELTHRNIIANLVQNNEPLIRCHRDTTATHQDVYMCIRQFSHIYGQSVLMYHKLSIGAKLVILNIYTLSPEMIIQTMKKEKVNVLMVPSSVVSELSSHPSATEDALKYLDVLVYGSAPLPASDLETFCCKAKKQIDIRQSYGLTETSPVVTLTTKGMYNPPKIGPPIPNTELRIVDQNLRNLGPNEIGEVLVRGPQVMRGYRNNPQANKETFTADGWLRTGDLGCADENGVLTISGRLKELIKVRGFPVPPAELESLFCEHPSVEDVGVVGVSHPSYGEMPNAFIVLKPGHKCTETELKNFVNEKVVVYKQVHGIMFTDAIPRNANGKILRKALKETAAISTAATFQRTFDNMQSIL